MSDWHTLRADAIQELRDEFESDPGGFSIYPEDRIHELADGMVPVYTAERFEVLASSGEVYGRELELAPEGADLATLAGIAIYEALIEALTEAWDEILRDREDEDA